MGGQSHTFKTCFIQQRATRQGEASRHPMPTSTQESNGTHAGRHMVLRSRHTDLERDTS